MSFKEQELIDVYNQDPSSLINRVVKVAVIQESVIANNSNSIILASIGNGNYWIIYDADRNYFLIPKAKLKIDRYRYEIVKLLFDCNNYDPERYSFKLAKPAQVSILANNSEWKLQKRGVLKFINPLNNTEIQASNGEKNLPSRKEAKSNSLLQSLAYAELLDIYNNDPRLLEQKATKVLETKNSINRKRAGTSQQILLEQATKSNYWVVYDDTDKNGWLFFKKDMRIGEYRYQAIQSLFKCYGYRPDYLSFELVKPAKLISLATREQKWIIEELGILKFI